MHLLRKLTRFRLRTLLALVTIACGLAWFFYTRPQELAREQTAAGRRVIHNRDKIYLEFVFDQTVQDNLVTVLGDSRLTHWDSVVWIECPSTDVLVSYGSDHALLAWNRDDGSIRKGFYDVAACAYASDAQQCFMVTSDQHLRSWRLGEEAVIEEQVQVPKSKNAWLDCSKDGRFLAYRDLSPTRKNDSVTIWDRETNRITFAKHQQHYLSAVAFSPDSKTVVLVEDVDKIREYSVDSGEVVAQQTVPTDEDGGRWIVRCCEFSEDGERLYLAGASNRVLVFDWKNQELIRKLGNSLGSINAIYVGNENHILTGGDSVLRISTWGSPDRLKSSGVLDEPTTAVHGGPTGTVAGVRGGRLVQMYGDRPRRMSGGPRVDATCFAYSPRGDRIALAGRDGQIVIRETATWGRVQSWRAHEAWIKRLVWSPDGDVLVSSGDDRVAAFWDPKSGTELRTLRASGVLPDRTITFDRDGRRLATYGATKGFGISIHDADSLEVVDEVPRQAVGLRGNVLFSHDGSRLYAGGSGATVHVWSLETDSRVTTLGPRTSDEVKLALSHQGDVIFATNARTISAFEISTGKTLWSVPVGTSLISDLSIHPTRPLLAAADRGGHVTLIDSAQGAIGQRLRLGPEKGEVLQVDFSPDGELLTVAMNNGAVVVLRVPDGR